MAYEVIIAGAGPVGLFLACELRLAGVEVLVLERMEDLHTPIKGAAMGARGFNLPSSEAFYRRGMLPAVKRASLAWMNPDAPGQAQTDNPNQARANRFAGHFAGIMIDAAKVNLGEDTFMLPGPSASGGMVSLEGVEEVLSERAAELGVTIRRGVEVTGVEPEGDAVRAQLSTGETLTAGWLVGCDGGRSTVRKAMGFEFVGTDPEMTGYIAMAELDQPEKLKRGWQQTPRGIYMNGPVPGRIGISEFDGVQGDRSAPVTREIFEAALRRVSGTDVSVTSMTVASRYSDHARQATTYRKGRVLLAGDAAHVHSPFGGQGMNLGLGDAMNLGWKLAATIKGWAPEGLLDSYQTERHPIGQWALEWTRAQVAILRPDLHAQALNRMIRELIETRGGATFFARKISGVWLHYDLPGDHPLIGHSAPDYPFSDGSRLGDRLRTGKAVLVDFTEDKRLAELSAGWPDRMGYVSGSTPDTKGAAAVFVRPDGFVAWAAEADPNPAQAAAAITQWLGRRS